MMTKMKQKYQLILASNSPRRRELLAGLDMPFEVKVIPGIEENYPSELAMEDIPQYIAREKASAYQVEEGQLVITADTIVVLDNQVFGKPKDDSDAVAMLRKLSGKTHQVITGVCLTTHDGQRSFHVSTEVTFKSFTEEEILYYVGHYHPLDKAGAYGIQEWIGYIGVTGLKGSFFNVMGFPVQRIYEEINKL
jgi:septum formation protein